MSQTSDMQRRCQQPGCTTVLSRYNQGVYCAVHYRAEPSGHDRRTRESKSTSRTASKTAPRFLRPTLEFCHEVLAVDVSNSAQLEAFLEKHHDAYRLMKQDNPCLSDDEICTILDTERGARGVHWPDVFMARQFELRLIIEGLFGEGNEGDAIEELNGDMIAWQLPPQVTYDERQRPRRAFHLYADGASSGMHIFRTCLRDIYFHFDTLEKIVPNTRQILFGRETARAKELMKRKPRLTYARIRDTLKEEFGKTVTERQLKNLKKQ